MRFKSKIDLRTLPVALALAGCAAVVTQPVTAAVSWPDYIIHLHASGKAFLVNPANDQVVAALDTVKGGTLGTTTPDGKKVYVAGAAEGQREVVVIDLDKKAVTARLDTGARPKHPQASPDGRWVGVNHWGLDGGKLRVSFIDTESDKVAHNVELPVGNTEPQGPTSMHNAWSMDSRYFFTVDRVDNQLAVIDTKDWSVREFDVASKPHYPVPSPDGSELWVVLEGVDRDNPPQAVVYDLTKSDIPVKATLNMPLIGEEVVEGHHGNFTQDGRYFMLLNRGGGKTQVGREVAFFDAKTKKLETRMTTASNGVGHAYNSPDGRYEVITNYGNNVITIVDLQKMAPVKDLMIGTGRMGHVAFTSDSRFGYVSNAKDGNLFKIDMQSMSVVGEIPTGNAPGGGQVLNVWTSVFEELPR